MYIDSDLLFSLVFSSHLYSQMLSFTMLNLRLCTIGFVRCYHLFVVYHLASDANHKSQITNCEILNTKRCRIAQRLVSSVNIEYVELIGS